MEEYFCLKCLQPWSSRVEDYKDWKRRKCPKCGSRETTTKASVDSGIEAVADSLAVSPPPFPPLPSAIIAALDVITPALRDPALPPRVLQYIWDEAHKRLHGRSPNP